MSDRMISSLETIKNKVLWGDVEYDSNSTFREKSSDKYNWFETLLSPENLKKIKMNEEDRLVARLVPDNDNRLYLPIDPRIKTSISDELNGSIEQLKEMIGIDFICSGVFHYPPGGYCGWHTNSNLQQERYYFVWAEEDNKSFFRYEDEKTGEIITKWEKKGWQLNKFKPPSWHCIGSYTTRISFGYAVDDGNYPKHYIDNWENGEDK